MKTGWQIGYVVQGQWNFVCDFWTRRGAEKVMREMHADGHCYIEVRPLRRELPVWLRRAVKRLAP